MSDDTEKVYCVSSIQNSKDHHLIFKRKKNPLVIICNNVLIDKFNIYMNLIYLADYILYFIESELRHYSSINQEKNTYLITK